MNKALFLDRDGTINEDTGYVHKISDFHFMDGVIDFCRLAQSKGFKIIVITNQSGIARGYFTESDYQKLNTYMCQEFEKQGVHITEVFHCPELSGPNRKPNAGLFFKAQEKYDIDMKSSVSVGDKERDILAALTAGVGRNYLLDSSEQSTKATKKISSFMELEDIFN